MLRSVASLIVLLSSFSQSWSNELKDVLPTSAETCTGYWIYKKHLPCRDSSHGAIYHSRREPVCGTEREITGTDAVCGIRQLNECRLAEFGIADWENTTTTPGRNSTAKHRHGSDMRAERERFLQSETTRMRNSGEICSDCKLDWLEETETSEKRSGRMRYWMDYTYGIFNPIYNVGRSTACGVEYNTCVVRRIHNECQRIEFGVKEYKLLASIACPTQEGVFLHKPGVAPKADASAPMPPDCSTCDKIVVVGSESLIGKLKCIDRSLRTLTENKRYYDDATSKWVKDTSATGSVPLALGTLKGGLQRLSKQWDGLLGSDKKAILFLKAQNAYVAKVLIPQLSQPQVYLIRRQFASEMETLSDYEFLAIFKTSPQNIHLLDSNSLFHFSSRLSRGEITKAARFRVADLIARTMYAEIQQSTKTLGLLYQVRADLRISHDEAEVRAIRVLKDSPESTRISSVFEKFQGTARERNDLLQNTVSGFIENHENIASRGAERLKAFVGSLDATGSQEFKLLGAYVALRAMDGVGFNNSIRATLDGIDRSDSPLEQKYAVADLVASSGRVVSLLNETQQAIGKLQAAAQDTGIEVVKTISEIALKSATVDTLIPFTTLLREAEGRVKRELGAGINALSRVESVFKDIIKSFVTGLSESEAAADQVRGLKDIQKNRFGT